MKPRALAAPSRAALGALLVAAWLSLGCATTLFEVDDAVRFEDGDARFVAFVQKKRGWVLRGVEGVEVRFAVDGSEVGRATTDERGFAKSITRVSQPTELFEASAEIGGERRSHDARVFAWQRDRVIVACDIDSTISQTDLGALFFDATDLLSKPFEGSPEVMQQIQRTHHVAYLTARPRFTLEKTRVWLESHGYPTEPIITSLTVGDALDQVTYKTRTLGSLRKHFKNLLIGIGNTDIDAQSYGSHGMLAVIHDPKGTPERKGNLVRLQSWQQISAFFAANADALTDPERVVAAVRGEQELVLPPPASATD